MPTIHLKMVIPACPWTLAPQYRSKEEEALAQREIELLGEDPYRYGFGENPRHNLAALLNLLARLGALERTLDPEELFVPGTYDSLNPT